MYTFFTQLHLHVKGYNDIAQLKKLGKFAEIKKLEDFIKRAPPLAPRRRQRDKQDGGRAVSHPL